MRKKKPTIKMLESTPEWTLVVIYSTDAFVATTFGLSRPRDIYSNQLSEYPQKRFQP